MSRKAMALPHRKTRSASLKEESSPSIGGKALTILLEKRRPVLEGAGRERESPARKVISCFKKRRTTRACGGKKKKSLRAKRKEEKGKV